MSDQVLSRLRARAGRLCVEIDARPTVATTFGRWFKHRLNDDDWIKSLTLVNFTRPIEADKEPLWKPTPEELAHIQKQLALLPSGSTTLDALEHILRTFQQQAVGGIGNWFSEIGGPTGYQMDLRIHSLGWEMAAIAAFCEWSKVSKLQQLRTSGVPDYLIDMGELVIVMEGKRRFGRSWPLVVLRTMLRALAGIGGMSEAQQVMIVADDPDVGTAEVERDIADLSIETLIQAVRRVALTGSDEKVTPNLIATRRTDVASDLGLLASYHRIETMDDWDRQFASLTPTLPSIQGAASDAWDQCDQHPVIPSATMRLNAAAITAESWPGHPDLSDNQRRLREWLETEVWPQRSDRMLVADFGDILRPVRFVSPNATSHIDNLRPAGGQ